MDKGFAILLLLIIAMPHLLAQGYKLGDVITNDDGSRGVVFYVNPDGSGGWMVALTDASTGCAWGTSGDIPALTNQNPSYDEQLLNDTDGYGNTEKIRSYQNNSTSYAAGKVDFAHGWYLPSAGQLGKLFGNLAKIEEAIAAAGGSTLSTTNSYWSSTEKDASKAYIVDCQTCSVGDYHGFLFVTKTTINSVRAIHDFGGGHTIVYDTTLNYYWNTGATMPYINVSPQQTTTYTVTATTEFGCSATAEQIVFVNPSGTEHVYDTVCTGYAYSRYGFDLTPEQTQTQGEATFSRDIGGGECTTTLTLHLYKREPTAGPTITVSTCENEAYYYNSYTYSVAGTYHQYYTAASGCDSIVTINLSVLPVSSSTIEQETCNSFTWNGEVYTESGTYEQTLQNHHGCDSVVTMYLTVNRDITRVISVISCSAYTWNGVEYTESGDYEQTFQSVQGCDSIVTLHLEFVNSYEIYLDTVHCGRFWFNGQEIETSGYYEGEFFTTDGCDSIVHLQLTVERFPETPSMEGQENVYVTADLETGVYHYEAHLSPNATHYEWSLTGADWLMDTIGTSCTLTMLYPGTGILTLRVWNECGSSEIQKVINADFFDVKEQEMVLVNIYPNPARDQAVVESEGIMRIRMYSIMGQLLQEIKGNGDDRVEISLRDYATAPYLLEVMTQKGLVNMKLNVVR